jgi:hypothetical protein
MLTFIDYAKRVQVQKTVGSAVVTLGTLEIRSDEKSLTTNGTQKLLDTEIIEIKNYTDTHNI